MPMGRARTSWPTAPSPTAGDAPHERGWFWPDHWLRMEILAEDFLNFVSELRDMSDAEREQVRALGPVNSARVRPRARQLVHARADPAHVPEQPLVGDARAGAVRRPLRARSRRRRREVRLMAPLGGPRARRARGVRGAPAHLVHRGPAAQPRGRASTRATASRSTSRAGSSAATRARPRSSSSTTTSDPHGARARRRARPRARRSRTSTRSSTCTSTRCSASSGCGPSSRSTCRRCSRTACACRWPTSADPPRAAAHGL